MYFGLRERLEISKIDPAVHLLLIPGIDVTKKIKSIRTESDGTMTIIPKYGKELNATSDTRFWIQHY